jgi:hypothetical protein
VAPGGDEPRSDPQEATASIASATAQREKVVNVFPVRMDAKPGAHSRRKPVARQSKAA